MFAPLVLAESWQPSGRRLAGCHYTIDQHGARLLKPPPFDPLRDRLSRDIRNGLSVAKMAGKALPALMANRDRLDRLASIPNGCWTDSFSGFEPEGGVDADEDFRVC